MVDLFQQYWWLLFPFFWFLSAGWHSMMRYKRTQAKIELLKAYAEIFLRVSCADRQDRACKSRIKG